LRQAAEARNDATRVFISSPIVRAARFSASSRARTFGSAVTLALQHHCLVRQSNELERGIEIVDLAARVAIGLNQRRGYRFSQRDLKPVRRLRRPLSAASRLIDQFVAQNLSDAAWNGRDIDLRQLLLDVAAADACRAVKGPEAAFTAGSQQWRRGDRSRESTQKGAAGKGSARLRLSVAFTHGHTRLRQRHSRSFAARR
jgi:hypothetical protein